MIKYGGDNVVEWIWKVFSMVYESGVVPQDWKFAIICSRVKER